jgi:hypothetical protein
VAGAAALAGSLVAVGPAAADLHRRLAWDARLRQDLDVAVLRAGGAAALRACGPIYAGRYRFPLVAWHLQVPMARLGLSPRARGVVLRSRLEPDAPLEPRVPPGFRRLAASPTWQVHAAC